MARIPVYKIKLPEYHVRSAPDHAAIGPKVDKILKKHFLGKKVAIRCLGSSEHKNRSVNDLVKIIKRLGTDRYDPCRKGDRYENVQKKHIDFFALDFKIAKKGRYIEQFIEPFYHWPKKAGQKPVRLDIAIIYDLSKLKKVLHTYKGRKDVKRDGFMFRDHKNKSKSVIGIIKLL